MQLFFIAVLSDNKWEPVREGFDFLYFVDNKIGFPDGARLEDSEEEEANDDERSRPPPRLHTREESAAEEKYDIADDVNADNKDQESWENEPPRRHDEF